MRRKKIAAVIHGHEEKVSSLAIKVAAGFDTEDIHAFRVEIKKFRAFIRLIGAVDAKLPKQLRRFNQALGLIRNLQLFRQDLAPLQEKKTPVFSGDLLSQIDLRIAAAKEEAAVFVNSKKPFAKQFQKSRADLPSRISEKRRHQFTSVRCRTVDQSLPDLERRHGTRKSIKDLLYAWPYLGKRERGRVSARFGGFDAMRKEAETLGNWLDDRFKMQLIEENDRGLHTSQNVALRNGRIQGAAVLLP